jgi:hypothetical protein
VEEGEIVARVGFPAAIGGEGKECRMKGEGVGGEDGRRIKMMGLFCMELTRSFSACRGIP